MDVHGFVESADEKQHSGEELQDLKDYAGVQIQENNNKIYHRQGLKSVSAVVITRVDGNNNGSTQ
jgi:hypothetical protein